VQRSGEFACVCRRTELVRTVSLRVQLVAGGGCLAAMDSRLLLQAASADRLDVYLDLSRVGPGGVFVGECLVAP